MKGSFSFAMTIQVDRMTKSSGPQCICLNKLTPCLVFKVQDKRPCSTLKDELAFTFEQYLMSNSTLKIMATSETCIRFFDFFNVLVSNFSVIL